eukprot:g3005.t1
MVEPSSGDPEYLDLSESNFTQTIESNDFTLVIFYVNSLAWEEFRPHFDALSKLFRDKNEVGVQLARVDVLKNRKLSMHSGLNTLFVKLFSSDASTFPPVEYQGAKVARHIYFFVKDIVSNLEANVDVTSDPEVDGLVRRFVRNELLASAHVKETDTQTRDKLAALLTLSRDELERLKNGDTEEGATTIQKRTARLKARVKSLALLLDIFDTIVRDGTRALSHETNRLKKELIESHSRMTYEKTVELTAAVRMWDYIAHLVMGRMKVEGHIEGGDRDEHPEGKDDETLAYIVGGLGVASKAASIALE